MTRAIQQRMASEIDQLRAEVKRLKAERDEWKRAHRYGIETIRILAERLPPQPETQK